VASSQPWKQTDITELSEAFQSVSFECEQNDGSDYVADIRALFNNEDS